MALVVHARSWTTSNAACNINWCNCAASSLLAANRENGVRDWCALID